MLFSFLLTIIVKPAAQEEPVSEIAVLIGF